MLKKIRPEKNGFTLIEILLSVALIGAIAGIGIPIYQTLQVRNDLDLALHIWADSLARAQILARAVEGDTSWGAKAETGRIVMFKGASYVGRDVLFDEISDISPNIILTGRTEIVFSKLSGLPQASGPATFSSINGDSRTATVNAKGVVIY